MSGADLPTLSQAIAAIRAELMIARDQRPTGAPGFDVGPVEVEFAIEIERTKGLGGLKVAVVELKGELSRETTTSHQIKVTLQPVNADGSTLTVSSPTAGMTPRPKPED